MPSFGGEVKALEPDGHFSWGAFSGAIATALAFVLTGVWALVRWMMGLDGRIRRLEDEREEIRGLLAQTHDSTIRTEAKVDMLISGQRRSP